MSEGEASPASSCANCGTRLNGPYCSACGQRHEPHIHSLWHFLSEAAESVTHADSRVWRTLWPLLAKPGFLTREFLDGRRARYLPPFRLYLVLSVVFFLAALIGGGEVTVVTVPLSKSLDESAFVPLTEGKPRETREQRANRLCEGVRAEIPGQSYIEPHLREGCRKIVMDGGRGLAEAFYHNIPRGLVLLLPLLGLVMVLMHRRRFYVEHLLFFLHVHSFAFLFLTFYVLLIRIAPWGWFTTLTTLSAFTVLPYYTYRAMLRVYAQGLWITRLKFSALVLAYLILLSIMVAVLGLYTMATL